MNKKIITVKVGTSTITNENGSINLRVLDRLCRVLSEIESMGYQVVLVSSGAIAVGVNKMRLSHKPQELPLKQAAAAVGQCELMHLYDKLFGEYGKMVAQILFTSEDLAEEKKRENLSNTLTALLANGIIPIINENDSISSAEIESDKKIFGDNDMLSALVAYALFRVVWCQTLLPSWHDMAVIYTAYDVSFVISMLILVPAYRHAFRRATHPQAHGAAVTA